MPIDRITLEYPVTCSPYEYQKERDAFRMKVITLLKDKVDLISSMPTLPTILKAPIDVVVIPQNGRTSLIQLFQKLGKYTCTGQFLKIHSKGKEHTIPLLNSFTIGINEPPRIYSRL